MERLLIELGKRYQTKEQSGGAELLYRRGKTEFHPTRIFVGGGESGRAIELGIDIRIPKGSEPPDSEPLLEALETRTMKRRGFERLSDETAPLENERGEKAGYARTLRYRRADCPEAKEAALHLRAILESLDLPIVVGSHEPDDVEARDPMPPPPQPKVSAAERLEPLRFRLDSNLFHDLSAIVDQNERTLTIVERRFLSSRQIGDVMRLAHVGKLGARRKDGAGELVAIDREGKEHVLATGSGSPEFFATAQRLAKGVRIPFTEL